MDSDQQDVLSAELSSYMTKLGVTDLTSEQREALTHISQCADTFIVLPTGSGKSLLFQLAPFCNANNFGKYFHYLIFLLYSNHENGIGR